MTNTSTSNGGAAALAVSTGNDAAKESLIGTERGGRNSNISWGSVVAGVMTFLAVTILLSLVTAGIGLGDNQAGIAAGIWSVIALAIALIAGGYVAGALALRSGLLHGFLTWATSLVVALALTVGLGATVLGAAGGIVGGVVSSASQAASGTDLNAAADGAEGAVSDEDVQNAQDQADEALDGAQQTAEEAADAAQTASWFGFAGLLIGAIIASFGGVLGVRSIINRRDRESVRVNR
jgi:uncharacterized membrane protein (GlpM family)